MTPKQRHARWRAQHASQHLPSRVRKPVVMLAPEGDATLNSMEHTRNAGWRTRDATCQCGYLVCAKRGPCAPKPTYVGIDYGKQGSDRAAIVYYAMGDDGRPRITRTEDAAPPPAPVAGEARRFVVGQRVRGTGGDIAGRLATVIRWESDYCVIVRFDGDDSHTWAHPGPLEPAPSPAVEPANAFDHAAAVIAAHDREAVERARGAR